MVNPISFTDTCAFIDGTADLETAVASLHQLDHADKWLPLISFIEEWYNESPNVIVQTSGSTGSPKAIAIAKQQMANSARMTASHLGLPAGTEAFLPLSVNYIAGKMMVVRSIVNGWKLSVIDAPADPMDNVSIAHKYEFTALVPYQLSQILLSKGSTTKLNRFKTIIVGGAPISAVLEKQLQELKPTIYQTYGMTETISHIAMRQVNGENTSKSYTAIGNTKLDVDEHQRLIIDAPDIDVNNLQTNDVVGLQDEQHFEWLGRFDNVINSGGVKLIPEQLEQKIAHVFEDTRYFLSAMPHHQLGEQLVLVIEANVLTKQQKESIYKCLSGYEKPKQIHTIQQFIETSSGKVQRKKSLELALAATEQ